MPSRRLSMVVPGLMEAEPLRQVSQYCPPGSLGHMETFLTRAQATLFHEAEPERVLCRLFNIAMDGGADVPVAALTRLLDSGEQDTRHWLRADPVSLVLGRTGLVMGGSEGLAPKQDEVAVMTSAINEHFAAEPWRIEAPSPTRWYIGLSGDVQVRTHALAQVVGKDINRYLPYGEQGRYWCNILNEIQMLLHHSPVNEGRARRGEALINSVWLWGGGTLPEVPDVFYGPDRPYVQVWSDDCLALALAKHCGTPRVAAPVSASRWLEQAITPGHHLVVLGRGAPPLGDSEDGCTLVQDREREWMAPLLAALTQGVLDEVRLYPCNGQVYALTRPLLRRWWRRRRAISNFI